METSGDLQVDSSSCSVSSSEGGPGLAAFFTDAGASSSEGGRNSMAEDIVQSIDSEVELGATDDELEASSVRAEIDCNSEFEDEISVQDEGSGTTPIHSASSEATQTRRSSRVRRKPDWYTGDVVTHNQQAVTNNQQDGIESCMSGVDWEQRAKFLAKLATSDTFARIPDSFCQAILKLVLNSEADRP